ncbi:AraC family transcriptional regulator [Paenibacillus thiaminolyticus]|uniref:AraC family transcriptional regulator n=1 Tax=Paenibacillus thiaminolyticus TaxID=49283 RepID=UPI00234FCE1B|nr:AraC family transcriptional regulator [Paenibacillus thiaminolyticus]WCR25717.1 AraC family transcriptional regulator [Paenibacillus thiaminolyticus]
MMQKFPSARIGMTIAPDSFYIPVRVTEWGEPTGDDALEAAAPLFRILIVSGGNGMLRINGVQHELSRGSAVLCGAGPSQDLQPKPDSPLRGTLIDYRGLTAGGSAVNGLKHPVPLHRCPAKVIRLACELERAWREPQQDKPLRAQQLFIELLAELYSELESRQEPASDWVEQALHYMESRYSDDLTREHMAALAHVSPEHFSRTFRKRTGRTFNAHLTLLRIRSAQRRLLTGAPDLTTLAQEVGYKDSFYLSRKFKQAVGISPTAYQRKRRRIAALNLNHTASLLALDVVPELGVYSSWLEQMQLGSNQAIGPRLNPYGHTRAAYCEAIAAAKPDVIINYSTAEENGSLLPVAPVLGLPFKTMNWREQFCLIADIADKRLQAERWLAHYDERIGRGNLLLDRALGSRGTAIAWEIGSHAAYCFGSSFGRGCHILYEDLGFRPPSRLLELDIATRGYIEADIESIPSFAADYIFIVALPSTPGSQQRIRRLFQSSEWLDMDPVWNHRVYVMNQPELFFGYDPISSQAQLSELLGALTSQKCMTGHHFKA